MKWYLKDQVYSPPLHHNRQGPQSGAPLFVEEAAIGDEAVLVASCNDLVQYLLADVIVLAVVVVQYQSLAAAAAKAAAALEDG